MSLAVGGWWRSVSVLFLFVLWWSRVTTRSSYYHQQVALLARVVLGCAGLLVSQNQKNYKRENKTSKMDGAQVGWLGLHACLQPCLCVVPLGCRLTGFCCLACLIVSMGSAFLRGGGDLASVCICVTVRICAAFICRTTPDCRLSHVAMLTADEHWVTDKSVVNDSLCVCESSCTSLSCLSQGLSRLRARKAAVVSACYVE